MHAACAPERTRPAIELADVVRAYGPALLQSRGLRPEQHKALRDIERCRTAALGGHLDVCAACAYEQPAYNSCRNRHCPKCQAGERASCPSPRRATLGRFRPLFVHREEERDERWLDRYAQRLLCLRLSVRARASVGTRVDVDDASLEIDVVPCEGVDLPSASVKGTS